MDYLFFMKQNQSPSRTVHGSKPEVKHHDFLTLKAHCTCAECDRISQPVNPEIFLDRELMRLREGAQKKESQCDFIFFLNALKNSAKVLPKFRFLDTIVMRGDNPYSLHFQQGKLRVTERINIKTWILQRKEYRDLKYQIQKHERQNNFRFTSFEHKCQKKIKQFQNNIKYKIPTVLNRTVIIKLRNRDQKEEKREQRKEEEGKGEQKRMVQARQYRLLANLTTEDEAILAKDEFENMFDLTKNRVYALEDIEYLQVFPVMSGEQQSSYIKIIKYSRQSQQKKKSFKLASMYVSTWLQKNDSLQKLQEDVYEQIKEASKASSITEQDKLYYQTYKLFIYFEEITNIRINQAIVHYLTNDKGQSFFFKKLDCLKIEKRASVQEIGVELPTKKDIAEQDYISLPTEMKKLFENFQSQFRRLDKEREEMEAKVKRDKDYSNLVYKTVSDRGPSSLHEVLGSTNLKLKKKQLNL